MASKLDVPKPLEDEEGQEVTPRSSRKVIGFQSFFHLIDETYEKKLEDEKRINGGELDEERQQSLLGSEPVPFDISSSSDDSDSESDVDLLVARATASRPRESAKPSIYIPLEKLGRASSADATSPASPASTSVQKSSSGASSSSQTSKNDGVSGNSDSTANGGKTGSRVHLSSQPRSHTLISPSPSSQTAASNTSASKRASAVGNLKSFWENLNEKERNEAERLRVKPGDVGRANRAGSGLGTGLPVFTRTESTNKLFGGFQSPVSPRTTVASSPRLYHSSEHNSPPRDPVRSTSSVFHPASISPRPNEITSTSIVSSPRTYSPRSSSAVLTTRNTINTPESKPSAIVTANATHIPVKTESQESVDSKASAPSVASDVTPISTDSEMASNSTTSTAAVASATSETSASTPPTSSQKLKSSRSSKAILSADGTPLESDPSVAATNELTKKTKRSSRKRSASPRNFDPEPTSTSPTSTTELGSSQPRKSIDIDGDSISQDTNTTSSSKHSKSGSRKASSISADGNGRSEVTAADAEAAVQSDLELPKERSSKKKHSKDTPRANSTSHIVTKDRTRKSSAGASAAPDATAVAAAKSPSKREIAPIYLNAQSSPELNFNPDTLKKQNSKPEVTSSSKEASGKYTKSNSKADVKSDSPRDKKKKSKRGSSKSSRDQDTEGAGATQSASAAASATSVSTSPEVPVKAGRKKKRSKKRNEEDAGAGQAVSAADAAAVSGAVAASQALTASANGQIEIGKLKSFFSNWESKAMTHSWEINPQEIEFVELIGEGTSCAVYKGTYRGQEVALKVLKDINTKQLTNFVKEFDIVSIFRSPHVVFFFGACIEPVPVMVLGLCARGSLYDVLKRPDTVLNWANVIKVSISTLRGLDSLHKWKPQILHRDLKSRNILVEDDWTAKLCDFGESRYNTGTNIDTLCKIRGTYAYISPEVYFGQSFTPKSDVYAFGVILWELCNRCVRGSYQSPFSEYKALVYDFQIIVQASRKGMRPTIHAQVPPALANIIRLCWDHEPANRPAASQILKFFEEIAAGDVSRPQDWDKAKYALHWPPPGGPGVAGNPPTTKGD